MKKPLILSLILAAPAFAGTEVVPEAPPPPVQDTWSWFVGASGGYLFEAEEDIYTLQLGAKSPWSVAGWSVALFGEVGWTENHDGLDLPPRFRDRHVEGDLDIIPLTFNVKLEHMFSGGWSVYAGAGVGASYVEGDYDVPTPFRDDSVDDWVFTGQVFAGVAYHVSESFELFGGGRWIYMDDPGDGAVDFGNDWMLEGGVRFHF